MPADSIFAEDHLVPISLIDGDLWFFSSLDGNVYCNSPTYSQHRLEQIRNPFVIPGDDRILDIVREDGELLVTTHALGGSAGRRTATHRYPVQAPSAHRPTALISGRGGNRCVVLSAPGESALQVIDLETADRVTFDGLPGSSALGLVAEGLLVEDASGYAVLGGCRPQRGSGSVVSVYRERFVVRKDDEHQREFRLVSPESVQQLSLPGRWEPLHAVVSRFGPALTGLHPLRGYGLYSEDRLSLLPGTLQLFGLGAAGTVVRQAGLRAGTAWLSREGRRAGVARSRPDIQVTGAMCLGVPVSHAASRSPTRTLAVALHGGPDSHEWDDLRYGGSYRELLDHGVDVLIVNYPGSRGLGAGFHSAAWGNWAASVTNCADVVETYRRRFRYREIVLLGASFGAWLAAQLAERVNAVGIVALSPILQVESHLALHSNADPLFARWARQRFGDDLVNARIGDDEVRRCNVRLIALVPDDDEIVRPHDAFPSSSKREWEKVVVPGKHYPSSASDAAFRWAALCESVLRLRDSAAPMPPHIP